MCFNPYNLGQILIQQGVISRSQADFAARYQLNSAYEGLDIKFGAICVQLGYCTKKDLDDALREQSVFCIRDHDKGSQALQTLRSDLSEIC